MWLCVLLGCGTQEQQSTENIQSFTASNSEESPVDDTPANMDDKAKVFVCKSAGAKKYHLNGNCHGLKRCKHEIVEMSIKDAENRGLGVCGYEN